MTEVRDISTAFPETLFPSVSFPPGELRDRGRSLLEGQVLAPCRSVHSRPSPPLPLGFCGSPFITARAERSLEATDLSRHCIFNLKHFLVLLAENANQEVPVCMSVLIRIFACHHTLHRVQHWLGVVTQPLLKDTSALTNAHRRSLPRAVWMYSIHILTEVSWPHPPGSSLVHSNAPLQGRNTARMFPKEAASTWLILAHQLLASTDLKALNINTEILTSFGIREVAVSIH